MKRLLAVPLIASLLFVGGCASTQPQIVTRYNLDPAGNLVQTQQVVPANDTGSKMLETVLVIGLGVVGLYFVGEVFDVWDDDEPTQVAAPVNPALVPVGGQTSWQTDYIQQTYTPL